MDQDFVAGMVLGGAVGGWFAYRVGNWVASVRAARSTYRTQRHVQRR